MERKKRRFNQIATNMKHLLYLDKTKNLVKRTIHETDSLNEASGCFKIYTLLF